MILPSDFSNLVKKAIPLIGTHCREMQDDELLTFLINNGIENDAAKEIILFLPSAFVRQTYPSVNWPDSYKENSSAGFLKKKYSETPSFKVIQQETIEYFENPDKEITLGIIMRSAEFNALNTLLLAHPDANIQDIKITELIINRLVQTLPYI